MAKESASARRVKLAGAQEVQSRQCFKKAISEGPCGGCCSLRTSLDSLICKAIEGKSESCYVTGGRLLQRERLSDIEHVKKAIGSVPAHTFTLLKVI